MIRSLLALALVAACGGSPASGDGEGGLDLARALGGEPDPGFERALAPREFSFPEDHGPHPTFRNEWWYITGNLDARDDTGRAFGYELTVFRIALAPGGQPPDRASTMGANQIYMAHFAITDVAGQALHAFDRFDRGAAGLAGAQATPFRVWAGPWFMEALQEGETFPARVVAAMPAAALDLEISPTKPVVLNGEGGLSRKGPEAGNASYYYSLPRLTTTGRIRVGSEWIEVTGSSWMDREWSTSVLSQDVVGWDWFALQLDDGRDVMLYQLRSHAGTPSPQSAGTLVGNNGEASHLRSEDFTIEVLEQWTSPHSGVRYPIKWRVQVEREGLDMEVAALLADQELQVGLRYWEGATEIRARSGRIGRGYVELTGYKSPPSE